MNRAEKRRQQKLTKKAAGKVPQQSSLLNLAVKHHSVGRLSEAESLYQQVLLADPNQPVALHLLGVIAHKVGKNDIAVDLISKSLAIKPDEADAHFNLGLSFHALGKHEEAIGCYNRAIALKPNYAEAYSNLGLALHELGQLNEAIESYNRAIAVKPDLALVHYNLGSALTALGRHEEAVARYNKAITLQPDYVKPHLNLGHALQHLGNLDEAVDCYKKAIAINPEFAEAHFNLGIVLQKMDRQGEAFTCHRRAVTLNPENNSFWAGLAQSFMGLSFTSIDDDLWTVLLNLIDRPTVQPTSLVSSLVRALQFHPSFLQVLELTGKKKQAVEFVYADAAAKLSEIPLLLRIMELAHISDLKIEQMFTALRHALLLETMEGKDNENSLPFAAALALQCFTNEYIYLETEAETIEVKKLEQQVEARVEKKQGISPFLIAVIGAYRPLHTYSWSKAIQDRQWGNAIQDVVERQISEPLEEQSLRSQIRCLTPIKDSVSHAVQEQYEENPYPRWVKTSISDKGKSIAEVFQEDPVQFDIGDYVSPKQPEILIAGCGTGQHAVSTASRFSHAHVLAVDLSLSSLSYALRKTSELGLSNIEYSQADIMELDAIGRQFDLIESVGVLHHLGDPVAGWQVLVGLLKPGGLMKIGLYSETARQCIFEGRSIITDKGYMTSPEDIRHSRYDFIAMAEDGNEEMKKIINFRDFFSMSECRDLLFHVQEHCFTLPQIEETLKSLNLKFLGFELQDQRAVRTFKASHPQEHALTSLALWNEFELKNPDTFAGMYSFWCQKM